MFDASDRAGRRARELREITEVAAQRVGNPLLVGNHALYAGSAGDANPVENAGVRRRWTDTVTTYWRLTAAGIDGKDVITPVFAQRRNGPFR